MQARIERAAILEFEAGLSREEADKEAEKMHPDPERKEQQEQKCQVSSKVSSK